MTTNPWLEIDLKGFAQTLRDKGIANILLEPISNALDTDATKINVEFYQGNGWATLTVVDDDPDGFSDLKDAYTLYAPSTRKADTSKRGRFGQGEKELIAICAQGGEVDVRSTTGTVKFSADGRHQYKTKADRTDAGSKLFARLRCTKIEGEAFTKLVLSLLVPPNRTIEFKSEVSGGRRENIVLLSRKPLRSFEVNLPTVSVDEEGNLRPTRRNTAVSIYEAFGDERPRIYELGVPVVETDFPWHIDVGQKVPLNRDRNNVTPAYLRQLREAVLNAAHDLVEPDEAKAAWITEALPEASPEALRGVVEAVHGKKVVIFDPSAPEASKRAIEEGYTVIYGRQFTPQVFSKLKEHDIARPAGQVIKVGIPSSPNGKPPIPVEKWTPEMKKLAEYTRKVGLHLLGFKPLVQFQSLSVQTASGDAAAWWGGGAITFNIRTLGYRWINEASQERVDALLIHEFAHHYGSDHYSSRFYDACCDLGAKLRGCKAKLR